MLCAYYTGESSIADVIFKQLEIRSAERGICPIAKSTMTELFLYANARNGCISTSSLKTLICTVFFFYPQ